MTANNRTEISYLSPEDARWAAGRDERQRGALGVVINRSGDVLLNLRDSIPTIAHPDRWSVLGGLCEPGEDESTALVRELAEEVGLVVADFDPLCRLIDHEGSGHLLTAFLVRTDAALEELVLNEGQALDYFPWASAQGLDLVPFARRLLTAYFETTP